MEVHHIIQEADGGSNTFDNAIPLCLNCHATVGAYNPHHPKGTKFSIKELKKIRDDFYEKIKAQPRNIDQRSEEDERLLSTFKEDFTKTLEYIIDVDISSQLISIDLPDEIDVLVNKWNKKGNIFELKPLEDLKLDVINRLTELKRYLSFEYLRLHESTGQLLFRNDSYEAGEKLREELQPTSFRIRTELKLLLDQLYMF